MPKLKTLSQWDVRNLLEHFAEPEHEGGGGLVQAQKLGVIVQSGRHPGEVRHARTPSKGALEASAVLQRISVEEERILGAVFDPQPETFTFTRQHAGVDFCVRSTEGPRDLAIVRAAPSPHDPYFEPHEAALLRYTPTLMLRAHRALERADAQAIYDATCAGGAEAFDVIMAVHSVLEERWTYLGVQQMHEVELHVVALIERSIVRARDTKDLAARDAAREVLATAKREASDLYETAADAYVTIREELFPKKRAPRKAAPALEWSNPEAWLDAAE